MADEREGFLDFRGMRVWYHVAGPLPTADGRPPLLLLHGGPGGTSDGFEPLDALAERGRTVVRYDELGSGRSDRPHDPSLWTVATFVELLDRVRGELRLDPLHLLGWSWGGMLALEWLRTERRGLASLTLMSTPVSTPDYLDDAQRLRAALPAHVRAAMARFEDRWQPPSPGEARAGVDAGMTNAAIDKAAATLQRLVGIAARPTSTRLAAGLTRLSPRSKSLYDLVSLAYVREHVFRASSLPRSMAKMLAGTGTGVYEALWGPSEFFATGPLAEWDGHDVLDRIDVPTLVTCGRHDTVRPERAAAVAARIRDAELVVFEESGHSALHEEPERFVATLTAFLDRVDARCPP